jgi:hypothetical protein
MPHPCYPCRVKEPSQGKTPSRSLENFQPNTRRLPLWTFLFGFSSLDFVIFDSGAVDLGPAAAKRSEEKKMSKWFGMISLWPLD